MSQHEKRVTLSSLEYPEVIPTVQPVMKAANLSSLAGNENSSRFLLQIAKIMKINLGVKWPLSGGIVNQLISPENYVIERIFIVGYSDGSIRIWDATSPVLSLLCIIDGEIKGVEVAGSNASVSELNFCSLASDLAVGNQLGLIRVYSLDDCPEETSLHIVTKTKQEVHKQPQGEGLKCRAYFHLLDSPIQLLQYVDRGAKLAVAHECGRVAVLDMKLFSVSFLSDSLSDPSNPVISITWTSFVYTDGHTKSPKEVRPKDLNKPTEKKLMFVSTKDAKLYVFDSDNHQTINSKPFQLKKETTAISIYVIEGSALASLDHSVSQQLVKDDAVESESPNEVDQHHSPPEPLNSGRSAMDSLVLICCKDALRLYGLKSVVQGIEIPVSKVKLEKPCCWTSMFKKDGKPCGLVLLYQTGELEVRSLPDLELVKMTSLMSILRWSFKANLGRTMSCTENGQIAMANGCEVAFISVLNRDNDFRIPESLPSLHDKVLEGAIEAAISSLSNQKKKQGAPGKLVNIVKGFKVGKVSNSINIPADFKSSTSDLDKIFSKSPFPDPLNNNQEDVELDIDDIEIDEPEPVPTSSHTKQNDEIGKKTDREKLFDGENVDPTPRLRTREEIIATYRKAEDASSVAGQARNKLLERQEKLERISKRTEDLRNGAEDFASLANELVQVMERRKWWQI